jgi:hypothetical protein
MTNPIDTDENTDDVDEEEDEDHDSSDLDNKVSIMLDLVKDLLSIVKLEQNQEVYLIYLKMYVKVRKILHLFASYDYLITKNITHNDLIDDLMLNIDDDIKRLEDFGNIRSGKPFTEKDEIIDYFKYSINCIREYKTTLI